MFGHLCFRLEDAKKDGHCLGPDLIAAQPQIHLQSLGYHTGAEMHVLYAGYYG
jgi:hypothetical protein